jgi:hypothetical protein
MRLHRTVAAAIVVAGLIAAAIVYVRAGARASDVDPEAEAEAYDLTHSRAYENQVERIGGKGTALAIEMNDAIAAAFHGRALAWTIAVGAVAVAAGYLLVVRLASASGEAPERGER